MAFHFALETVLRFQKSLERQQELLLQVANYEVAQVLQQMDRTNAAIAWTRVQEQRTLSSAGPAVEIHFLAELRKSLQAQQARLQGELEKREAERRVQLQAFEQLRRKRETIETLRERQQRAFRERHNRELQRQIDDLFLILSISRRKSLPG
jgi:flagellar export protein FliJ